jgi:hypothetical protein
MAAIKNLQSQAVVHFAWKTSVYKFNGVIATLDVLLSS